jgi:hypothetical protein
VQAAEDRDRDALGFLPSFARRSPYQTPTGSSDDELRAGVEEQLGELRRAVGLAAAGDAEPREFLGDDVEREGEVLDRGDVQLERQLASPRVPDLLHDVFARAGEHVRLRERRRRGKLVRLQHPEVDVEHVAVDHRLHERNVIAGAERRHWLVDRLRRVVGPVGEDERLARHRPCRRRLP